MNPIESGSFRDPSGQVVVRDGRIFRTVMPRAAEDYEFVRNSGLLEELVAQGLLVSSTEINRDTNVGNWGKGAAYILEHPKLPFISYPYEWSFSTLKAACLVHLDIHLRALNYDITLSDASAYNIQFLGSKPIFIDRLSFVRYNPGAFWLGHRQFCEQFLNPLLLRSLIGIPHNSWYRGSQEGIQSEDLVRLLPWKKKFSLNIFKHVILMASLQKKTIEKPMTEKTHLLKERPLPLASFQNILKGLKAWVEELNPLDTGKTIWGNYAKNHSYSSKEVQLKHDFVGNVIHSVKPKMVWDFGCNTGDYSVAALKANAPYVIGFDFDQKALELAFARAKDESLSFLPLFLDAGNPAPNQGFGEQERQGLKARANPDCLLALAFTHHLAIGRNVPLPNLLDWLISLAPHGVIEFVPKSDPMIQEMLSLREDIFDNYTGKHFMECIEESADIVEKKVVSHSGRQLIWYARR